MTVGAVFGKITTLIPPIPKKFLRS